MVSPSFSPTGSFPLARHPLRFLPLFAILSCVLVTIQLALHLRNIPYWDEVDGVLTNVLRLDLAQPLPDGLASLFALQNEHRTFTSNLLFATLFRLTGTLNFTAIAIVGNLFLLGLCAVLVERAGNRARATRLAAVLGLGVIHLQHHESLFWGGSSIDHFHVVLLAVATFAALSDGTRRGLLGGLLLGLLGAYTLAHGAVIWPVGAALLASQRRWRALAAWAAVAGFAVACYLPGFSINPAHHIEAATNVVRVAHYWLTLLGATPAVSSLGAAPWLGLGLLGSVAWLALRGAWRTEPLAAAIVAFCVLSLGVIAVGRAGVSAGILIPSRYCILSALAWALTIWVVLERELARPACSWTRVSALCAALVALNVAINLHFFHEGARFARQREDSAEWFHYYHTLDGAPFALYPHAAQADRIFRQVAARGIYTLPNPVQRVAVPEARLVQDVTYVFDDCKTDTDNVYIRGWAFAPRHTSTPGDVHIIFQSASGRQVYAALPVPRPDVAAAFHDPQRAHAGFRLVLPRSELPKEMLTVGVLFKRPLAPAEFALSDRQVAPPFGISSTRLLTHR